MNDWQEHNALINRNFTLFLTGGKVKVLAELLFWGLSQTLLTCWQSATVDCKICIWFSLKHTGISDFWKIGKQAPLKNNCYSEGPVCVICFLKIRGSMASVLVLLETFIRKMAATLAFPLCNSPSRAFCERRKREPPACWKAQAAYPCPAASMDPDILPQKAK